MYNRYLQNDHGVYTRITPPPTKPPVPPAPQSNAAAASSPQHDAPNQTPHDTAKQTLYDAPQPAQRDKEETGRFLNRILKSLHLGDLDSADLMLLALLFFLFEEKADDELLIALGLLLIL